MLYLQQLKCYLEFAWKLEAKFLLPNEGYQATITAGIDPN